MANGRVLLIEDDVGAAAALKRVLAQEGFDITTVGRGDEGLARATAGVFDVVVTDLKLPGMDGLELVQRLHSAKPRLPIILMTAHGTTETAITATKLGAFDYLLKPFEMSELIDLVEKAAASSRLMSEPVELGQVPLTGDAIIGNSRVMQGIYKEIGRIAATPVTVLIRGETGVGKELIARAIYQHSDRSGRPFIAVNCAAIPETLLESELFGHERGAFTGAEARRVGRFEQADQGTIFLDEVGELSLSTQAKLLRVLQERTIQRLGGKELIAVDIRVIAATHRDLERALHEKQFREDLYYRLNVVALNLPPLRQRTADIPALVNYLLHRHGVELGTAAPSIHPDAVALLQEQSWHGNVRELENVVRQLLLLARGYAITRELVRQVLDRSVALGRDETQQMSAWVTGFLARAEAGETERVHGQIIGAVDRELFAQAIHLAKGNQAQAARWLGVSRLTMREKLIQFGLHPAQEESDSG